jgi:hypothetical protein
MSEALRTDLDRARAAREALLASSDLHAAADHWRDLLHRLDRFWNRFNAHFNRSPRWNGWSAGCKAEVKRDPLLLYLSKARDADHHTIGDVIAVEGGALKVEAGGRVILKHAATPNTWDVIQASGAVVFDAAKLVLKPATNYRVTYDVPRHHLGRPVDPNDVALIADLAINYFALLLARAEAELCSPQTGKR